MSFPLQQGGFGGAGAGGSNNRGGNGGGNPRDNSTGDVNANAGKKASNPTSIDAMFQSILPSAANAVGASPATAPRQLSGLNPMNLGPMASAAGGMVPPSRLSMTQAAAAMSHHQNSLNSSLGEEIKRLQQLHQLTSGTAAAAAAAGHHQASGGTSTTAGGNTATTANQLMQGLLAGRAGGSIAAMSNLGNLKNPAVAAHQAQMLHSTTTASAAALGSLSQRDAALFALMSQQQQQQQHQQQQQLQQQQLQQQQLQQQQVLQQQQQALQQQLAAGGSLLSPTATAQLMAAATASQAQQMLPSPSMLAARAVAGGMGGRPGPGAIEPFPEKLHRMLMEVEALGKSHIISFVDDGRAFAIHKPNQFFKEIVPLYFRQSRLSSFKRQLNLYGFELISNGPSRGAYFHELFQRDKPTLCRRMRRVAVKVAAKKDEENESVGTAAKDEGQTAADDTSAAGSDLPS